MPLAVAHPLIAHQVLELAAYAAGFQLYLLLRRRLPAGPALRPEQTAWMLLGAIFGALVGAKGLAWAESFPLYIARGLDWRLLIGGKTIVGAILGGWIGVEIAKRRMRLWHPTGDVYVFPLILGMCIGRVGCFLAGLRDHTAGTPTSLPWGVDFGDGIPRHPTQIYEIVFLVGLAAFFAWRVRAGRQRGCMFGQFVVGYLAFRLAVEFVKPRFTVPYLGLSPIQLAAIGGIAYALLRRSEACCGCESPLPAAGASAAPHFVELTNSLCPHCLRKIEAKVMIDGGGVWLHKFCPDHGPMRVLVADDVAWWQRSRAACRPGTPPLRRNTDMRLGCPHDCGLCPDHEQHSCLAIVEITDRCDAACPVCYAASGRDGRHRSVEEVTAMLDAVIANEGQAGVVQISGGEPALHPELFAILEAARARPIRHVMLNTNGRRIAADDAFVKRLAGYLPRFEVYLQFDSLRSEALRTLRGEDLTDIRRRAIDALNRHGVSTTLVVTLAKGVNDDEIGPLIDYAIAQPCVRGVTFQPVQAAGRVEGYDPARQRLTLTEVRRRILQQQSLFTERDIVPVPCNPDAIAMAYALRRGRTMLPLSRLVDPQQLASRAGDTICFEQDLALRRHVQGLFSAAASPASAAVDLNLVCCTPPLPRNAGPIGYEDVFRVIIMQFMDAWSMDLRALKRSCVHVVTPEGRLVPFETYNLLYRSCQLSVASCQ